MKKSLEDNIFVIVTSACAIVITLALWYGYPYDELTDKNLKVYQITITALAALIGVGTLLNSARSSRISAESIEITKEKESREQSPHLIVLSESLKVPLTAPMYKEILGLDAPDASPLHRFSKVFYTKLSELKKETESKGEIFLNQHEDALNDYEKFLVEYGTFMQKLINNKLGYNESEHSISVLNSGKGTAVNIEYEFIFENYKDFNGYKFSSIHDEPALKEIPRYSIIVEDIENEDTSIVVVKDGQISREVSKISQFDGRDESYFPIENKNNIYLNVIPSGETHRFPIPNSFSVLAKHYMICQHYKENYVLVPSDFSIETISIYKKENAILPRGKVIIRYTDDELARSDNSKKNKIELVYEVCFKETKINFFKDTIDNIYLEANYISSKKS